MTTAALTSNTDLSGVSSRNLSDMYLVAQSTVRSVESTGAHRTTVGKAYAKLFRIEDELKSRGLL